MILYCMIAIRNTHNCKRGSNQMILYCMIAIRNTHNCKHFRLKRAEWFPFDLLKATNSFYNFIE